MTKNNVKTLLTLMLTANSVFCDFKLLILHNNDMHSHFEEMSAAAGTCKISAQCYGGFARTKKKVDEIRTENKGQRNVIFLNAGDTFQGTPYYTIFKWKVVADLIDRLGIDVMSLGNHEFDDSPAGLAPYLNKIKTVSLAANIDISEEPVLKSPNLKPYEVLNVNGTKIGVIGYLTPNTTFLSSTGNVKFLDEVESINKYIAILKEQNINIFIALGHSGYNVDLEIARQVPDIDIVVGGHSNTFLYNGDHPDLEEPVDSYPKIVTQESGRKVPVVQAFAFTKYLGHLEVDFDETGEIMNLAGNPILLTGNYPQDEELLAALKPWHDKMDSTVNKYIGKTLVFLDSRNRACKFGECNIGNLIVDAMIEANVEKYVGEGWTDAPIAVMQAGGIRASIALKDDGNITYGDALTVLPIEDEILKVKLKGIHLKEMFEHAVHKYELTGFAQAGEFLQVSGIKVKYDMAAPPGSRVIYIQARCGNCSVPTYSCINETAEYSLIISSFLANGGDNYKVLKNNVYDVKPLNITLTDALVNYITKKSPIFPAITNRITIINPPSRKTRTTPTFAPYTQTAASQNVTNSSNSTRPTSQPSQNGANNLKYMTSLLMVSLIILAIRF